MNNELTDVEWVELTIALGAICKTQSLAGVDIPNGERLEHFQNLTKKLRAISDNQYGDKRWKSYSPETGKVTFYD